MHRVWTPQEALGLASACSTKGLDALRMCSLGPQLAVDLVAQIDGMDKDKGKLTEVGTQHIYRNARISAITRDNAMLDMA
jgi:hypothetical protein